MIPVMPA